MNVLLDLKEISSDAWQIFKQSFFTMILSILGCGIIELFLSLLGSRFFSLLLQLGPQGAGIIYSSSGPLIILVGIIFFIVTFALVGNVYNLFHLSIYNISSYTAFSFLVFSIVVFLFKEGAYLHVDIGSL